MTLEQLKAALEAALTKLKASPNDAKLKQEADEARAAYDTALEAEKAKESGEGGKGKEDDPKDKGSDEDDPSWDPKTKDYIQKLRKENASHRTRNKELTSKYKTSEEQKKALLKAAGIEVEEDKPEERVKTLSIENQQIAFRAAILESAIEHGIAKDDIDYYEFLMSKAVAELEEGDELSEEKLAEIIGKCKARGGKGPANSSVNGGKGGGGTPPPANGEITLDQFVRMSITEKSNLYIKSKDVYEALWKEARAKKRI